MSEFLRIEENLEPSGQNRHLKKMEKGFRINGLE